MLPWESSQATDLAFQDDFLGWVTPAVRPGLHLTAGTMRRVQQVREFGECPAPADLGSDGFYTRGSGTETSEYVRTSGCGWRTEMRISSAKDGHKPVMTTMWLKKGHGFELRRLLMRKKPVQIALVSTNRWMQPNSLIWMCHHSNVSRVKTQVPTKSSSMTRRIRWWSKSDVLLTDSGPGNYMIGKHRVHLQVLSLGYWSHWSQTRGWSAFTTGVSTCVQQPLFPGVTEMGSSAYFCIHDLGWVSTTLGNHVSRDKGRGPASFQAGPGGTLLCSKDGEKVGEDDLGWMNGLPFRQAKVCGFAILMFLTLCSERLVGAYIRWIRY